MLNGQGRVTGPLGMIFMGDRRAEKGHHPISGELVDRPFVAVDLIHENLETPVHDCVNVFRIEFLGQGAKPGHIGEHHGDDLALPLDGASGGEDLIGQVFRGVGLGLLIVDLRRFLGLVQVMATFAAEHVVGKDWSAALWAKTGSFSPHFCNFLFSGFSV